jgi:Cellulose binding domain
MRTFEHKTRLRRRLFALLAAAFGAALLCAATMLPAPAATPSAAQADVIGNATHFDGLGQPYGGCGLPQAVLETQDFVALNVYNTPGDYAYYPRPIPDSQSSIKGLWDNGHNCGRWVKVTIGDYCTGINDGAPGQPFCRNGAWTADAYNGATLDMLVADSCGDSNAWCRDDPNHLDLATASLNRFTKNGATVSGLPDHWNNRHVSWSFEAAPAYSGDVKIGFIQGAQRYWAAVSVTHLPNGLHGIEYLADGTWHSAQMNSDMGQSYILAPTTTGGTSFTVRLKDVTDAYVFGGRTYSFSLPASCGGTCSQPFTAADYTTDGGSTTTPPTTPVTTPPTTPVTTPPTTPVTTPPSTIPVNYGCRVEYRVTSSWPGGYQLDVTVTNSLARSTSAWAIGFTLPSGVQISNIWNAAVDSAAPATTVRNVSYNGTLASGATTSWGMTLSGSDQHLGTPPCTAS